MKKMKTGCKSFFMKTLSVTKFESGKYDVFGRRSVIFHPFVTWKKIIYSTRTFLKLICQLILLDVNLWNVCLIYVASTSP